MPVPPTHWLNLPGSVYRLADRWRAVERELGVHALGVLGNDDAARKLTPLIRAGLANLSINVPPLGWIFSLLWQRYRPDAA